MEVFEWQVFRQKPDDALACVWWPPLLSLFLFLARARILTLLCDQSGTQDRRADLLARHVRVWVLAPVAPHRVVRPVETPSLDRRRASPPPSRSSLPPSPHTLTPLSLPPFPDRPLTPPDQARLGLLLISELLLRPSTSSTLLSSGPLRPFAFDPVPSPLTLAVRQKLVEARSAWQVEQDDRRRAREGGGEGGGGEGGGGEARGKEPSGLRLWRERWRGAVQRGRRRFRQRVCAVTGLLCDESEPVAAAAAAAGVAGGGEGPRAGP